MKFTASIVIPTCHRPAELRDSVRCALAQTVPVEVIVMDDAADMVTADMLKQEFPGVRYFSLEAGRGPAFQRNRGIELASADVVFPIDDDSVTVSPRTVEQTLQEFEDARIGAVGIPYILVNVDQVVRQRAPDRDGVYVTHSFVGASHAVRRDVFLKAGGYRDHFFYMGEEGDLCLRMLIQGYVTRLGGADPIHHLESPRRNLRRAGFSGRRNDILFTWHNVPMPYFFPHLIGTTLNGLSSAIGQGCFWSMIRGMAAGYWDCLSRWNERSPVRPEIYRLHRSLKKGGPRLLSGIESLLPYLDNNTHGVQRTQKTYS